MRQRLRRLWAPTSLADDLAGGFVAGVAITLAFRFFFGDAWPPSLAAGAFAMAAASYFGWQGRAQRRERARARE